MLVLVSKQELKETVKPIIQIQGKQQFTKAIERAKKEHMLVSMIRFRKYHHN